MLQGGWLGRNGSFGRAGFVNSVQDLGLLTLTGTQEKGSVPFWKASQSKSRPSRNSALSCSRW